MIDYQNGHSEPAPGPVVAAMLDKDSDTIDSQVTRVDLALWPMAEGFVDLGLWQLRRPIHAPDVVISSHGRGRAIEPIIEGEALANGMGEPLFGFREP